MKIRSTIARTFLLAAVLSIATAGCGKRGTGDDAAAGAGGATGAGSGSGSTSSGSSSTGGSGAAGAGSAGMASGSSGDGGSGMSGSSGSTGGGSATGAGVAIDDSIITTKLKTALLADAMLKGSDISVETRNGEVSMTGTVTSAAQKDHAASVAQALSGVKNVNNKLAMKK